jgi:hypothetical protein
MSVDHIGYAVRNIEEAKKSLEVLGFAFADIIKDEDRNICICFGEMNGYRVELIAPISEGSPVDVQLAKIGPTPYHICYKSADIENDIARLEKSRFKVTVPLAPAVAFGGKRVVFMYSLQIGLIEIVEK